MDRTFRVNFSFMGQFYSKTFWVFDDPRDFFNKPYNFVARALFNALSEHINEQAFQVAMLNDELPFRPMSNGLNRPLK